MSRIFNTDLSRTIASLVAALLFSTTFVVAAVGPATNVGVPAAQTTELSA